MINLESVSNPVDTSGLESALEAAPPQLIRDGGRGAAKPGASRAGRAFLVIGKGDSISARFGGGVLESVIGVDMRERILETDLDPWRMVCALRMSSASGGSAIGTGWLAGPRTIVTAGHCVHHQGFFNGWAQTIEVSAGRNGSEFPFKTITSTRFSSVDLWVNTADPDFDIGCIHLDEPLGEQVGWFAFGSLPPAQLEGHMVNISGYPGDRGNGTEQYFHANRVLHVGDRRVFYDVDTFGGQSGAPVWIHETEDGPPVAVAIHAYGTGGTPFDLGITANSAPRIIPEVFNQITAWVDQDNNGDGSA